MTVIADAERAQGVAGVMGGSTSEVSDTTTDIFLEVAYFDPSSIRRTRRALQLSTDASYRFERGIDIEGIPRALERAAQLLIAVAGGSIEGAPIDLYPVPRHALSITIDSARVAKLLGEPVAEPDIAKLLAPVGFAVGAFANARASVTVPTWRPDVTQSVDLVEEIARLRGYDSFSNELRPFRRGTVPDSPLAVLTKRVRERCVSAGLLEALSMPFVRGGDDTHVKLANPMAVDEGYLRRDLLETLAKRAEHNLAQRHRDVRLFEIGSVFAPTPAGLPREEMRVAAIVLGHRHPPHWSDTNAPDFDEWDAKGSRSSSQTQPMAARRWSSAFAGMATSSGTSRSLGRCAAPCAASRSMRPCGRRRPSASSSRSRASAPIRSRPRDSRIFGPRRVSRRHRSSAFGPSHRRRRPSSTSPCSCRTISRRRASRA